MNVGDLISKPPGNHLITRRFANREGVIGSRPVLAVSQSVSHLGRTGANWTRVDSLAVVRTDLRDTETILTAAAVLYETRCDRSCPVVVVAYSRRGQRVAMCE